MVCPVVRGWPKAPPSKLQFHRIYPSLEEMTCTRVALDILGIPRSSHHRDSDYVTFRLLPVLVVGINCRYDPRQNESRLHYARDALRQLHSHSGGSVHSVIRSLLNTPLTYLPAHTQYEITRSWETRLSPSALQSTRAESPPTPAQGHPDHHSDDAPSDPDEPTAAELAALAACHSGIATRRV